MTNDSNFIFEAYKNNTMVATDKKNVRDGHGKLITIGDFISLIDEPDAMGEVREVLPNNILVIQHDSGHSEVLASDVELRPEGDYKEEAEESPDEDVEYLYTMIEGAIGQDKNIEDQHRQTDKSIFVNFSNKGYKITVTPL